MVEKRDVWWVVVGSPSDVPAEREAVHRVCAELNRSTARDRGLVLEVGGWDTDAYPGFHPEGPQSLIDACLGIEDCDVFIGVFWKRFGTPVPDAGSGTEHEIRKAYAAWQDKERPQVMMYFNQAPYFPQSSEEAKQQLKVLKFREAFPKEGLWCRTLEPTISNASCADTSHGSFSTGSRSAGVRPRSRGPRTRPAERPWRTTSAGCRAPTAA